MDREWPEERQEGYDSAIMLGRVFAFGLVLTLVAAVAWGLSGFL